MTEFVASNGNKIRHNETGLFVEGSSINDGDRLFPSQVAALREFFQAERDTQLGRWRSKEHPNWVGYGGSHGVTLIDERDGYCEYTTKPSDHGETSDLVATEFFAAHPEPKPWHEAKPGDIWALTDKDGATAQYLADQGRFFKFPLLEPREPCWQPAGFASDFTAGRRIWPES